MRLLRILVKSRKALKLMSTAMQKYLSTYDLRVIVIDRHNAAKKGNEEDDSGTSSAV